MLGLTIIQKKYLALLESELEFWRNKARDEQNRADRLFDLSRIEQGQLPISEAGVVDFTQRRDKDAEEYARRQKQIDEIYNEQISDIEGALDYSVSE